MRHLDRPSVNVFVPTIAPRNTRERADASKSSGRLRHTLIACGVVMLLGLTCGATSAAATFRQQTKVPKIEQSDPPATQSRKGNRRGSQKPGGSRGGGQRGNSSGRGEARSAENRTSRNNTVAPDGKIKVVIVTELPGTNLFLNNKPLDISGFDRRVETTLEPKTYALVASRTGQQVKEYSITVSPTQHTFDLKTLKPIARRAVVAAQPNANQPPRNNGGGTNGVKPTTPNGTASSSSATAALKPVPPVPVPPPVDPSVNPEEVARRFLDPKLTDTITERDWQEVERVASAALRETPDNAKLKGFTLFAQAQLAHLRKDYASAAVLFNNARLAVPDSALAYYGTGNNLLATNQPAEAAQAYARAVQIDPQFALGYKGLGDAAAKQKKTKDAFAYYDRARALGLESSDLNYDLARNHIRSRRWQQAIDALTPLAQSNPTAELFVMMGDSYVGLRQPQSALQAYKRATEIDSNSALGFYKYGATMFSLREYAATIEAMERALAIDTAGETIDRARARDFVEKANKAQEKLRGK